MRAAPNLNGKRCLFLLSEQLSWLAFGFLTTPYPLPGLVQHALLNPCNITDYGCWPCAAVSLGRSTNLSHSRPLPFPQLRILRQPTACFRRHRIHASTYTVSSARVLRKQHRRLPRMFSLCARMRRSCLVSIRNSRRLDKVLESQTRYAFTHEYIHTRLAPRHAHNEGFRSRIEKREATSGNVPRSRPPLRRSIPPPVCALLCMLPVDPEKCSNAVLFDAWPR
jgi:hypothetical protein